MGRRRVSSSHVVVCAAVLCGSAGAWANETQTYTYDARGRLIKVQSSGTANNNQVRNYCYDKAGNRETYDANTTPSSPACVKQGTPQ